VAFEEASKRVLDILPSGLPTDDQNMDDEAGPSRQPRQLEGSFATEPVELRSLELMQQQVWNLHSLDAVIVSANYLQHHINDLLWIQARLMDHQAHILRCRNFAQRNLDAIQRALYVDTKLEELRDGK
jgi:hypothetical protein